MLAKGVQVRVLIKGHTLSGKEGVVIGHTRNSEREQLNAVLFITTTGREEIWVFYDRELEEVQACQADNRDGSS
jgi:hypothetical protein